jgi:hypothetical protein
MSGVAAMAAVAPVFFVLCVAVVVHLMVGMVGVGWLLGGNGRFLVMIMRVLCVFGHWVYLS